MKPPLVTHLWVQSLGASGWTTWWFTCIYLAGTGPDVFPTSIFRTLPVLGHVCKCNTTNIFCSKAVHGIIETGNDAVITM